MSFFIIVLVRVWQLYPCVPSSIMRDQSIIVHLKNVGVLIDFICEKILTHRGKEKFVWKRSQRTRAKKIVLDVFGFILGFVLNY